MKPSSDHTSARVFNFCSEILVSGDHLDLAAIEEVLGVRDRILAFNGEALTAKELSLIVKVTTDTIYEQAKRGDIPSFRIGSAVRFDPKALIKWFERQ
jgi:excisionase family DNA binding protein